MVDDEVGACEKALTPSGLFFFFLNAPNFVLVFDRKVCTVMRNTIFKKEYLKKEKEREKETQDFDFVIDEIMHLNLYLAVSAYHVATKRVFLVKCCGDLLNCGTHAISEPMRWDY